MSDSNGYGGTTAPLLGFVAGVVLVGFFVFILMAPRREVAELDIHAPALNAPSVHLSVPQTPAPPAAPTRH